MRRWVYDILSLAAFGAGIFALLQAVRLLSSRDYVGAIIATVAAFLVIVASSELFRFALSVWITEQRKEK